MSTVLGSRAWFYYVSDTGREYAFLARYTVNNKCGNEQVLEGAFPDVPKFLKPRKLCLQSSSGAKKQVRIGMISNPLWSNGGTVVLDGVVWTVTSRIGECDIGSVKD